MLQFNPLAFIVALLIWQSPRIAREPVGARDVGIDPVLAPGGGGHRAGACNRGREDRSGENAGRNDKSEL